MIRFCFIYALCAIGCYSALKVHRPEMKEHDAYILSAVWPAMTTAALISISLKKDENK